MKGWDACWGPSDTVWFLKAENSQIFYNILDLWKLHQLFKDLVNICSCQRRTLNCSDSENVTIRNQMPEKWLANVLEIFVLFLDPRLHVSEVDLSICLTVAFVAHDHNRNLLKIMSVKKGFFKFKYAVTSGFSFVSMISCSLSLITSRERAEVTLYTRRNPCPDLMDNFRIAGNCQ